MWTQISYAKCGKNLNEGIQKIIEEDRVKYKIPAIQVSISCPGENLPRDFVSGTTTLNGSSLIKPDNLLQIGSETKSFTAGLVLMLEAEGLLSIDDPIGKWLPQFPEWKNITIRQLLNHTSGIVSFTDISEYMRIGQDSGWKKQWTPKELISFVINKPLYFSPGAGWHYSSTNYVLAGMVIHAVTGKSVEEEMHLRLFKPLNLFNTYYLPHTYDKDIMQRMVHGYLYEKPENPPTDATNYNMSMADAAGAIVSTSHDTAIWLRRLFNGSILPIKQLSEMLNMVDTENGQPLASGNKKTGYGLAIWHDFHEFGEESWGHNGTTFGYRASMTYLKCHDVVITTIINNSTDKNDSYDLTKDLISYIQKSDVSKKKKAKQVSSIINTLNK